MIKKHYIRVHQEKKLKTDALFVKSYQISRISQRSFLTISSAFVGLTFRVNSFLGVRSFSLTTRSSRLMLQYSALSAISMNLSTSKISTGIFLDLAGSYRAASSILSFVVPAREPQTSLCAGYANQNRVVMWVSSPLLCIISIINP